MESAVPVRCLLILLTVLVVSARDCPVSSPCTCRKSYVDGVYTDILYCSRRGLTQVPYFRPTTDNKPWAFIDLEGNRITELTKDSFQNIKLERIDLTANKIRIISDNETFTTQTDTLKILKLDRNGLRRIGNNVLSKLIVLYELSLQENEMEGLPQSSSLQEINLFHNKLTDFKIEREFFPTYDNLRKLLLNGNYLTSFPKRALGNKTRSLEEIYLSQNRIHDFDESSLSGFPNLTVLDLGVNNIGNISSNMFVHVPKLKNLKIYGNRFTFIENDTFMHTPDIETLDIGNNNMHDIPSGSFPPLRKLKTLFLYGLSLGKIREDAFFTITSTQMQHISIGTNRLSEIPAKLLQPVPTLYSLYLNGNLFKQIPIGFFKPVKSRLQFIKLEKNPLETMPEAIQYATNLYSLDVQGCNLVKFSGSEIQSKNIGNLYLRNNKLRNFPYELLNRSPNLYRVDLKENLISQIDACALIPPRRLSYFLLDGNPLHCDCHLYHVRQRPRLSLFESDEKFLCDSPAWLKGKPITTLTMNDFNCTTTTVENLCPRTSAASHLCLWGPHMIYLCILLFITLPF